MKNIKKIKPAGRRAAGPTEAKSGSTKSDKSETRPILFARPCIPVDGN